MGEQADLILNGDVCEGCGENFHDEGLGYPRRCSSCGGAKNKWLSGNPKKHDNIKEAERLLKAAGFEWKSFNNGYHWKIGDLDFYPSTHRWEDRKKDFHGYGLKEFIKYVANRIIRNKSFGKILTVEQVFDLAKESKDKSLFAICEAIHKGIYGS